MPTDAEPAAVDSGEDRPVVLSLRNVSKSFGSTKALKEVDLDLRGGEIHALCGQNGSGKSTLIKILSAYHSPDGGASLSLDGEEVKLPLGPGQPDKLGIRFVQQDLGLAPTQTVLDNFFIGGYPRGRTGLIAWRAAQRRAREALARFDVDVPVDSPIEDLGPALRAVVAIARSMSEDSHGAPMRVLILDEPTAHLPAQEVDVMMVALRSVASQGVAVALVTHRLDEVMQNADCVTVLRDGRRVSTTPVSAINHDSLVEMMLGRSLGDQYPEVQAERGRPLLELSGFSTGRAESIDLVLDEGEILGVTGLVGAGFEDLPYGLFGARPFAGEVRLSGEPIEVSDPADAIRFGMALVPADRTGQAGVGQATLVENLTLPSLELNRWGPLINSSAENKFTADVIQRYDVQPRGSVHRPLATLSGGNQQKLLMAKWLERKPRVLLLHEPTQGVDVGSRRQLFDFIADAVAEGCGVILASADYADLARLCHRILVFQRGRVTAELTGSDLDEDRIAERSLQADVLS